jgi:hypothetical protein
VLRRILLIFGAVTLVGAFALPARAQEADEAEGMEGMEAAEAACVEVAENVLAILPSYEEGEVTAQEAAEEIALELESVVTEQVSCSQDQIQEFLSFIEETYGASDVVDNLCSEHGSVEDTA